MARGRRRGVRGGQPRHSARRGGVRRPPPARQVGDRARDARPGPRGSGRLAARHRRHGHRARRPRHAARAPTARVAAAHRHRRRPRRARRQRHRHEPRRPARRRAGRPRRAGPAVRRARPGGLAATARGVARAPPCRGARHRLGPRAVGAAMAARRGGDARARRRRQVERALRARRGRRAHGRGRRRRPASRGRRAVGERHGVPAGADLVPAARADGARRAPSHLVGLVRHERRLRPELGGRGRGAAGGGHPVDRPRRPAEPLALPGGRLPVPRRRHERSRLRGARRGVAPAAAPDLHALRGARRRNGAGAHGHSEPAAVVGLCRRRARAARGARRRRGARRPRRARRRSPAARPLRRRMADRPRAHRHRRGLAAVAALPRAHDVLLLHGRAHAVPRARVRHGAARGARHAPTTSRTGAAPASPS